MTNFSLRFDELFPRSLNFDEFSLKKGPFWMMGQWVVRVTYKKNSQTAHCIAS